ncbi:hypothetical protein [Roseateles chitinivorans]|uniref:hypothetical protein n=1 Tax=Roseateles chitinivorans TaxID=2917965 RepID=UPI003D66FC7E
MKFDEPRKALRIVARRLEKDGYTVLVEPELTMIPFSLSGYLPDLLAMRGREEKRIVNVNFPGRAARSDAVLLAGAEAQRHPGWGLLFCNVREDELLAEASSATGIATLEDVDLGLEKIDQLTICEQTVSFIVPPLWTVLLQLLKLSMRKDGEKVDEFSDRSLLNWGYSMGYLPHEQLQDLQKFLSIRNHVVHGLEFHVALEDCQQMRKLASEWRSQVADDHQISAHPCAACGREHLS